MLKCAKLKIFGQVQGVFFRDHTQEKATELGVAGWVRNMPDGTVEALIEGPADVVEPMIVWCHKGPSSAKVDKVEVEWVELKGCEGFEVKY